MNIPYKEQIKHPLWQQKRLEIMNRDNFCCVQCKSKEKQLNVHHLIYRSNTLIWDYDNELLITFCKDCHSDFHQYLEKIIALMLYDCFKFNIPLIEIDIAIQKLIKGGVK